MGDEFQYFEYLAVFVVAGFASGYLSGLFGIGGGILRIPIFVFLFPAFSIHGNMEIHVGAATSLALAVPTGVLALRKHVTLGNFDPGYFRTWAVGLIAGVLIGLALVPFVSGFALKILFILFMLAMAAYFGFVPEGKVICQQPPRGAKALGLSGFVGAYCVMIGIAGGSMATPIMKATNKPLLQALAIGSGTSMIVSALGTIGGIWNGWDVPGRPTWSLGYVDGVVFAAMLPGVFLATPWGVGTAAHMNKQRLKVVYAVFLVIISATMIAHLIWG